MPVCALGSEPRSTSPALLGIDWNYMSSLLPPGMLWLRPFLPYMPTIAVNTSDICAIDPPDPPSLDPLDLLALFDPTRQALKALAVEKISLWVLNAAWYALCQCSDGSTPTATTLPTTPSPLPVINPPGTTLPTTDAPCQVRDFGMESSPYWSPAYINFTNGTPAQPFFWQLPNATTDYNDFAVDILPGVGTHVTTPRLRFDYYASTTGSPIGQQILTFTDNARVRFTPTSGALYYVGFLLADTTVQTHDNFRVNIRHYCSPAGPGAPVSACCPPDPTLQATLAAVLELTTLIQRQLAPFAFIDGAVHSGLTGAGEFAVSSLVGARIEIIDSLPGTVGVEAGVPETLFGAGWIRWGEADYWREREWLDSETRLSTPYAASVMTRIGYSLPPGLEIRITELEREP